MNYSVLLLVLLIVAVVVANEFGVLHFPGQSLVANPTASTVGTTMTTSAVSKKYQQKGFFANGRFWVFYNNLDYNTVFRTSTDGSTWSSETAMFAGTTSEDFCVDFDGSYVHYCRVISDINVANWRSLFYRRGTPNSDGTITWSTTNEQTVSSYTSFNDYMYDPTIAVDSSGFAWIVVNHSPNYCPVIFKNSKTDGTWVTASGFPYQLSSQSDTRWSIKVMPLATSGQVYVLYWCCTHGAVGRLYDGASWGKEENVGNYFPADAPEASAIAVGNDVCYAYTSPHAQVCFNRRVYGVGWNAADTVLQSTSGLYFGPCLSNNGYDLYCFWSFGDHIYYKMFNGATGSWDATLTDWIAEPTEHVPYAGLITSFWKSYSGHIGFIYLTKTTAPYNLKFAYLSQGTAPPPATYALTVNSAHDSPMPSIGSHTYSNGSSVTCNVTNSVTEAGTVWTCTGWTGTGSVPTSGTGSTVTFTIAQDSSITWNWQGVAVTVMLTVTSAHGNPVPNKGLRTYNSGTLVACSVASPVTEGSLIWTCTGWTGTGSVQSSGSGTSTSFTITQDSSITWNWQSSSVQHTLTVSSTHGNPNPSAGSNMYSDGSPITCSVTSSVTEGNTVWTCSGWVGTGSVPATGSVNTVTFTITQDSSITWNWNGTDTTITIHDATMLPEAPTANESVQITCQVDCQSSLTSVQLHYGRVADALTTTVDMTLIGQNVYQGSIPQQTVGPVYWKVTATSLGGGSTETATANYSVSAIPEYSVIMLIGFFALATVCMLIARKKLTHFSLEVY